MEHQCDQLRAALAGLYLKLTGAPLSVNARRGKSGWERPFGDDGTRGAWSVILMVVRTLPDREGPASALYRWREAVAYESRFLRHLSDRLAAPRCSGVQERAGGRLAEERGV